MPAPLALAHGSGRGRALVPRGGRGWNVGRGSGSKQRRIRVGYWGCGAGSGGRFAPPAREREDARPASIQVGSRPGAERQARLDGAYQSPKVQTGPQRETSQRWARISASWRRSFSRREGQPRRGLAPARSSSQRAQAPGCFVGRPKAIRQAGPCWVWGSALMRHRKRRGIGRDRNGGYWPGRRRR